MKGIKTLIKLKNQELDEKKKNLNIWLDHRNKLEKVTELLDEELKAEQEIATELGNLAYTYNDYYKLNRGKKELIVNEIKKYNKLIEDIQEQIFVNFTELKKYEIVLENQIEENMRYQQRKDQSNLDELAINQHLQKYQDE